MGLYKRICNITEENNLIMKRFLIFGIILSTFLQTYAQKPSAVGIIFDKTFHDFGEVLEWENQPAYFTFTNNSGKPVTVLPIFSQVDLEVLYPSKAIQPGESFTIQAIYYTPGKGIFNRKFEIYFGSAMQPEVLTIAGNIKSLSPKAYLQCPSSKSPQAGQKVDLIGSIENTETGQKIPETAIEIVGVTNKGKTLISTDKNGSFGTKLSIGNYEIVVLHPDYLPYRKPVYIGPNMGRMNISLTPVATPVPIVAEVKSPQIIEENIAQKEIPTPPPAVIQEEKTEVEVAKTPSTISEPVIENDYYNENSFGEEQQTNAAPKKEISEEFYYTQVVVTEKEIEKDEIIAEIAKTPAEPDKIQYSEQQTIDSLNRFIAQILEEKEMALKELQKKEEAAIIPEKEETIVSIEDLPAKSPSIETIEPVSVELSRTEYSANNIMFLIDISLSMSKNNKMDLLKESMKNLIPLLRDIDRVAVIAYNQRTYTILESVNGNLKETIVHAIDSLTPGGLTYGVNGIQNAYEILEYYYIPNGNNQIILATDGLFSSVNQTMTERELHKLVKDKASKQGINLSVVGFGNDPEGDLLMTALAANGNGKFIKIRNTSDAQTVLIDEIKLNSQIKQLQHD
jgi:Mg-chelatase subunit ChlD